MAAPNSAISLQTIAQKAGVSAMTASRVLRNSPRVAPATRRRVLAAEVQVEAVEVDVLQRLEAVGQALARVGATAAQAFVQGAREVGPPPGRVGGSAMKTRICPSL